TSTSLNNGFSSAVRGVVTDDGSAFWISGNGSGDGGVWYEVFGLDGANQILTTPSSVRAINIAGGQLYADSGNGSFPSVFTVGSGVPESIHQTATLLPGLPTSSGPSPYGFAFFDRTNVRGIDTLYIADDRAITSGTNSGGIQKWTSNGSTWSLQT